MTNDVWSIPPRSRRLLDGHRRRLCWWRIRSVVLITLAIVRVRRVVRRLPWFVHPELLSDRSSTPCVRTALVRLTRRVPARQDCAKTRIARMKSRLWTDPGPFARFFFVIQNPTDEVRVRIVRGQRQNYMTYWSPPATLILRDLRPRPTTSRTDHSSLEGVNMTAWMIVLLRPRLQSATPVAAR
jgi:hypothetical protein